jgi:hypothetical protein
MGADLYNERFNAQSAEYQNAKTDFEDFKKTIGNGPMSEVSRKHYGELLDKMYAHPHYFRESYGGGGLLAALDLSWWNDVIPLFDINPPENLSDEEIDAWHSDPQNDINMSSDACQKFIDLLESRKGMLDAADYDRTDSCPDWRTGEIVTWHVGDELRKRYDRLVDFLTVGVKHGGIYASL